MYVANKSEKAELICVLLLFEKDSGQKSVSVPSTRQQGLKLVTNEHLPHYKTKAKQFLLRVSFNPRPTGGLFRKSRRIYLKYMPNQCSGRSPLITLQ